MKAPNKDLTGFRFLWSDDFDIDIPKGQFPQTVSDKWWAYPYGFKDTSQKGFYDPSIIYVQDGVLNIFVYRNGVEPRVAAPIPILKPGTKPYGQGILYGRVEMRIRSARLPGYKIAPLFWPDEGSNLPFGEINWPEGNLNGSLMQAFMHRLGATVNTDQDAYDGGVTLDDWGIYVIEWTEEGVKFFRGNHLVGHSTTRIPNTKMHFVFQVETEIGTTVLPDPKIAGRVEIDYIAFWERDLSIIIPEHDIIAPKVKIVYPNNGGKVAPNSAVEIKYEVDEDIVQLEWFLNNDLLKVDRSFPTFPFYFRTTTERNFVYNIKVIAYDKGGNSKSDQITITTE